MSAPETPPRAWGRHFFRCVRHLAGGNTPTCVGKTMRFNGKGHVLQKHPHVRGEDGGVIPAYPNSRETPPRAWGRRLGQLAAMHQSRNTPTCVGKTGDWQPGREQLRKHPHVRGEDLLARVDPADAQETPPRAWGRPTESRAANLLRRNTPTCVGKTPLFVKEGKFAQKHPHVRGEDPNPHTTRRNAGETPPRAWGRQLNRPLLVCVQGNTPTCVGKTAP